MNEGWIKLHRQSLENDIIQDATAWQIFTWLLLKVDRTTGRKITGRFWASEELAMKPITFYKALKRLEKKYKVVTLLVTGKATEISLINWEKYQSSNTSGNTSVTHEEHISNTSVTLYNNREVKNKEMKKKIQPKISNRLILSRGQLIAYAKEFIGLTTSEIKEQREKCNAYMNMSSENYTNPGLFFRKWLTRYQGEKKVEESKVSVSEAIEKSLPIISEEERKRNLKKMEEMRGSLASKLGVMK